MKNTILEHLHTLPTDHPRYGNIRERAIDNYDKNFEPEEYEQSLKQPQDALLHAFDWECNGYDEYMNYWKPIHYELYSGTLFDYQKEGENNSSLESSRLELMVETMKHLMEEQPELFKQASPSSTDAKQPWISVKDSPLEKDISDVVATDGVDLFIAYYRAADNEWNLSGNDYSHVDLRKKVTVNHYLPKTFIPEPPKE